ncbi:MAG: hypothetical protein ACM3W7_02275, partial [Acidobacteriota bacterium]
RFVAFRGGRQFRGFRSGRSFTRFHGGRSFARFRGDRRFFHHRPFFAAAFIGAPFFYDYAYDYDYGSCWVWRPTPFGWRRVYVCGPEYSYYTEPYYDPYVSYALY